MSVLPKYHRLFLHGEFFSVHKDITGRFWVLSNSYPESVYTGPFDSFPDALYFSSDVNQRIRWVEQKGVFYE